MMRGRKPVVRANREWVASVTEGPIVLDSVQAASYQLLIGTEGQRPALGLEPKVIRIHGENFFRSRVEEIGLEDLFVPLSYVPKFRYGVCLADADAFQDFLDTGNVVGLPELDADPGSGEWLLWRTHTLCPPGYLTAPFPTGNPADPTEVGFDMCCTCWSEQVDIRAQRRIKKDQVILAAGLWANPSEDFTAVWDFDCRSLVQQ